MGGYVNLVKKENDKISSIEIHTENLLFLQDPDFLNKTPYNSLHESLSKSKSSDCFPNDYGLVVVDFDTKWIGSIQNYTDLSLVYATRELSAIRKGNYASTVIKKILKAGFVSDVKIVSGSKTKNISLLNLDPKFFEILKKDKAMADWILNAVKLNNNKLYPAFGKDVELDAFYFTPPSWDIVQFQQKPEDFLSFFKKLNKKGFCVDVFSSEWVNYVDKFKEEYKNYNAGDFEKWLINDIRMNLEKKLASPYTDESSENKKLRL